MLFLDCYNIADISEVESVDCVGYIQSLDNLLHSQPCKDILIAMAADMEIARHLLNSE